MIEKIACNACGAPLEVLESTRFATCHHCGSQLRVQRTGTATFTEAIEKLEAVTGRLEQRVDRLSTQNELAALDREWQIERENYFVSSKHRGRHLPTKSGALAGGIFGGAFALFWTAMAFTMTSAMPNFGPFGLMQFLFPLFGIGFFVVIVWNSFSAFGKADRYEQSQRRYRKRRLELEAEGKPTDCQP